MSSESAIKDERFWSFSKQMEIHLLVRKFRAEAKKLAKVIGNRALIEMSMRCFTPTFSDMIEERLIVRYDHYKDPMTCLKYY